MPAIICYTKEQMIDLKHFLTHEKEDPLDIDRMFNLGSFYVMTIVYKNQRIVRKENRDEHPIFLGPVDFDNPSPVSFFFFFFFFFVAVFSIFFSR